MSELEQLDEYIDKYIEQSDPSSPWHIPSWVHDLAVAAQAYRDLLANGRVDPDYQAAAEELQSWVNWGSPSYHDRVVRAIVDAAVGGRLLANGERVWWCVDKKAGHLESLHCYTPRKAPELHGGCGWRLLVGPPGGGEM